MEEPQPQRSHGPCGCAANARLHPARHVFQALEPGAQHEQRIRKGDRDDGCQQAQDSVPNQGFGLSQRVKGIHMKHRVRSKDGMLNHGRESGGHNHAGEHGLVQIADQLLQGEGDGGDGRVEGCGNARRHAHGSHAPRVLGAEPRQARKDAADPRADLHGGPFQAQRGARADLQGAQNELANRLAHRNISGAEGIRHLDLGNPAARRRRSEVGEAHAGHDAANGGAKDGPKDPAMAGGGIGAIDQQRLQPHDAQVEGHRGQPAQRAGQNGDGEQALPLRRHAPEQPDIEMVEQTLQANPIAGLWHFLVI